MFLLTTMLMLLLSIPTGFESPAMTLQWDKFDPRVSWLQGNGELPRWVTKDHHVIPRWACPEPLESLAIAKDDRGARAPQLDLYRRMVCPRKVLVYVGVHMIRIDDDHIGHSELLFCLRIHIGLALNPTVVRTELRVVLIVYNHVPARERDVDVRRGLSTLWDL
jgi:hypothetical protein